MSYPAFFDKVEKLTLYDPLAEFLGSFDKGIIKLKYINSVQSAGHSCPTVAGAYLMTLKALKALYPDMTPIRGEIKVEFKESLEDGVAGVISNVISNITGATDKSGFKGIGNKFVRHSLMHFDTKMSASARFTRTDNGKSIEVNYNPSMVPGSPNMQPLMQKIMQGLADDTEKKEFGNLWQKRVEEILCNYEKYDGILTIKEV
jgi:formylmethanofuran dehydrogenase subunit E